MRDQAIEFLAGGFSPADVATTLGCSEAAIKELLQDKQVLADLASRAKELQQSRIEKRYGDLEEATLKQLKTDLGMLDAASLCRVLETVAKNRVASRSPANHYQNPTVGEMRGVTLVLPADAGQITVDSKNQVISIGSRNMAAMPVSGVQNLFAKLEESKRKPLQGEVYENASAA